MAYSPTAIYAVPVTSPAVYIANSRLVLTVCGDCGALILGDPLPGDINTAVPQPETPSQQVHTAWHASLTTPPAGP